MVTLYILTFAVCRNVTQDVFIIAALICKQFYTLAVLQ